jgi:hypothetical protein
MWPFAAKGELSALAELAVRHGDAACFMVQRELMMAP